MSEKASKGTFLKSRREKLQNHSTEGKGKEKKKERGEGKEEKGKKAMVEFLVFIIATSRIKLCDAKDLFGDSVIKNPGRYTYIYLYTVQTPFGMQQIKANKGN